MTRAAASTAEELGGTTQSDRPKGKGGDKELGSAECGLVAGRV